MSGEKDLSTLIENMRPMLQPETYVFVYLKPGAERPQAKPILVFEEEEGTTLIVTREAAAREGLVSAFPCRIITLRIQSALDAVGFIAAVTSRLAEAGISTNPVSAFFHDHVFVPASRAEEAVEVLERMRNDWAARH